MTIEKITSKDLARLGAVLDPSTDERLDAAVAYRDIILSSKDPREIVQAYVCLLELSGECRDAGDEGAAMAVTMVCADLCGHLDLLDAMDQFLGVGTKK